jgi:hypothetical protein
MSDRRSQHPDAWIIAVCEWDFGASCTKILVAAPNAPVAADVPRIPNLRIEGFDEWEVSGDLRAALVAAGTVPDRIGAAYDASDDGIVDHDGLLHMLTGDALSVHADEERCESTFVVERSEQGEDHIGEVWFP